MGIRIFKLKLPNFKELLKKIAIVVCFTFLVSIIASFIITVNFLYVFALFILLEGGLGLLIGSLWLFFIPLRMEEEEKEKRIERGKKLFIGGILLILLGFVMDYLFTLFM